jgi:hypothetical protein
MQKATHTFPSVDVSAVEILITALRSASSFANRRGGHEDRSAQQHSTQVALAPEQYGRSADTSQLIKFLRLALAPPLSRKARNSLSGRGGQEDGRSSNMEQQRQHSTDASPSPASSKFTTRLRVLLLRSRLPPVLALPLRRRCAAVRGPNPALRRHRAEMVDHAARASPRR